MSHSSEGWKVSDKVFSRDWFLFLTQMTASLLCLHRGERKGGGISFFPLDPSSQIRYCPDDLTQAQFHHHRSQWSRGWVDFGFGVYTVWESTILSGSPLCSYIEEAAAWCSWSLHSCRGAASWSLLLSLAGGQILVQEETEGHRVTQGRRAFLDKQLFLK